MAVPGPSFVVGMAPLLVGSARRGVHKTCAQECGDEESWFHVVSKVAGMCLRRSTSAVTIKNLASLRA